jgi:uncharacterized membrane protein
VTLESSKNLGGVGAILLLIGTLPVIATATFGVLALVGVILVLVALHGLAEYFKERGIFNNFLYGVIVGIVGVIIGGATLVYLFFYTSTVTDFLYKIYPSWNGDWTTLSGLTPITSNINPTDVIPFLASILSVLVVFWIFIVIGAFFARRSLKTLSTKGSVGLLSTGALILLIGAVLTIVVIGIFLIWFAILLIAIAFFQIKPQSEQTVSIMAPPPPTPV